MYTRLHRTPPGVSPGRIRHETETARFCIGRVAGALNSSKQSEAPPLPPDLLNLGEDYLRICFQYAVQGEGHPTAIRLKVGFAGRINGLGLA